LNTLDFGNRRIPTIHWTNDKTGKPKKKTQNAQKKKARPTKKKNPAQKKKNPGTRKPAGFSVPVFLKKIGAVFFSKCFLVLKR